MLFFMLLEGTANADNGGPGDQGGSPKDLSVVATAAALVIGLVLLVNIDDKHDTGEITVDASGGEPGYTYQWDNNETGASIKNLKPGTYTVTVTDSQGHTAQKSFTVEDKKSGDKSDAGADSNVTL